MKKEKITDKELAVRLRINILAVLELWSSKEAQLDYQKNVPIAQVSAELFEQWNDFYYPTDRTLQIAFDENELKLLKEFDAILDKAAKTTPDHLPPIELFVCTLEWKEVNKAAIELLRKLKGS